MRLFGFVLLLLVRSECGTALATPPKAVPGPATLPAGSPADGTALEAERPLRFVDVTGESGLHFEHNHGGFGERWLPETLGPGVVVFDADSDGNLDLLFLNGRSFPGHPEEATTPALYLGREGMLFQEATEAAGLGFSAYCLGGAAGDVDNDGDTDLFLACLGRDRLLRNEWGRFEDVSEAAGLVAEEEFGVAAAFFDANRDGYLDLYATRYVTWAPETDLVCTGADGVTKVYCTPGLYRGARQRYYRNLGDGTFEEVADEVGLALEDGKMLGVVPFDADGDGWADLAVAGDTHQNLLYRNLGDGTFEEVGVAAGIGLSLSGGFRGGMGITTGDYDRSGRQSLAVSYFANDHVGLYRNQGQAFFLDQGARSEIGRKTFFTLGWGCFFFDYDLDGWLDFLVANGHLDDDRSTPYAQPQQLFRNLGDGDFREVTDTEGGDLARPIVGRGAAYGDFDLDGDLDVVLTTNGGPAHLFENRGEGHGRWLRLDLEGTTSNRDGLGATIEVRTADGTQTWYVHSGGSYLSQSQVDATFGLGRHESADEVVIRWPSGTVQRLIDVAADQRLRIYEPSQ